MRSTLHRKLYRAVVMGDIKAALFLRDWAITIMRDGQPLPRGMSKLFARVATHPHIANAKKPPKQGRGRPSIDNKPTAHEKFPFLIRKRFFGEKPSEKIALMVAYVASQGHPLNREGNRSKESAFVLVARITNLSTSSIENYHSMHRNKVHQRGSSAIGLGEALYLSCQAHPWRRRVKKAIPK